MGAPHISSIILICGRGSRPPHISSMLEGIEINDKTVMMLSRLIKECNYQLLRVVLTCFHIDSMGLLPFVLSLFPSASYPRLFPYGVNSRE